MKKWPCPFVSSIVAKDAYVFKSTQGCQMGSKMLMADNNASSKLQVGFMEDSSMHQIGFNYASTMLQVGFR